MSQVYLRFDSVPPFLWHYLQKRTRFFSRTHFSSARNDKLCEDHDREFTDCNGVMDWPGRQITVIVIFDLVKLRKCMPSLDVCRASNCAYPLMFQVCVLLRVLHFLWAPRPWIFFFLVFSCVTCSVVCPRQAYLPCWNSLCWSQRKMCSICYKHRKLLSQLHF